MHSTGYMSLAHFLGILMRERLQVTLNRCMVEKQLTAAYKEVRPDKAQPQRTVSVLLKSRTDKKTPAEATEIHIAQMAFIKEEIEETFRVKHEDTEEQTKMEFIKEESEDMKTEETFRVKHEDTEEQTAFPPLTAAEQAQLYNNLSQCHTQEEQIIKPVVLSVVKEYAASYVPKAVMLDVPEPLTNLYNKQIRDLNLAELQDRAEALFEDITVTKEQSSELGILAQEIGRVYHRFQCCMVELLDHPHGEQAGHHFQVLHGETQIALYLTFPCQRLMRPGVLLRAAGRKHHVEELQVQTPVKGKGQEEFPEWEKQLKLLNPAVVLQEEDQHEPTERGESRNE
ncbi:hypothetical protein cypCar_00031956 [Cyprinus carpio]|nr:hypothetical protein cypCar_00031956 [Cyprinus carpio]